jgi:hypothetical protein
MMHFIRTLAAVMLLFGCATAPAPALAQSEWSGVERVVAIGDLEGAYEKYLDMLRTAGLIDDRGDWIGGRAHLVQLGDVPDRGPNSRAIMDHLMRLERQAQRAGGRVHALIGNHEAMNVEGDLRYVHPGEYAAFATRNSERVREQFYRRYIDHARANPPPGDRPPSTKLSARALKPNIRSVGWSTVRPGRRPAPMDVGSRATTASSASTTPCSCMPAWGPHSQRQSALP